VFSFSSSRILKIILER